MNEFQKQAVQKIDELAKELGGKFEITSDLSKWEKFIEGNVLGFNIWIYPEGGADFSSEFLDERFEWQAYKDKDKLLEEFTSAIRNGIVNKEYYRSHPEKWIDPIFNQLIKKIKGIFR